MSKLVKQLAEVLQQEQEQEEEDLDHVQWILGEAVKYVKKAQRSVQDAVNAVVGSEDQIEPDLMIDVAHLRDEAVIGMCEKAWESLHSMDRALGRCQKDFEDEEGVIAEILQGLQKYRK